MKPRALPFLGLCLGLLAVFVLIAHVDQPNVDCAGSGSRQCVLCGTPFIGPAPSLSLPRPSRGFSRIKAILRPTFFEKLAPPSNNPRSPPTA
ncbi:MAG: hypothetical protein HY747_09870 [Elusimicrobia bacterium]|nr:hypothetical protein [Elusimicrobiota bacterium]